KSVTRRWASAALGAARNFHRRRRGHGGGGVNATKLNHPDFVVNFVERFVGESGRGLPHSKPLRESGCLPITRERLGVRQSSSALGVRSDFGDVYEEVYEVLPLVNRL